MEREPRPSLHPPTLGKAFLASILLVPIVSIAAKVVIEGLTTYTDDIHWRQTVPWVILLFTVVLNVQMQKERRERLAVARREEAEDPAEAEDATANPAEAGGPHEGPSRPRGPEGP